MIGDIKNNKLYAIKRVTFKSKLKVELKFIAPAEGEYDLNVYCICDSYLGCDQVIINRECNEFNYFLGRKNIC